MVVKLFLLNEIFYYFAICKCVSATADVNDTVKFTFYLVMNETEHYHCHKFWFAYCNTCTLAFHHYSLSSLKLKNELKKHVWNVAEIKCGFAKLVVTFFHFLQDVLMWFLLWFWLCNNINLIELTLILLQSF